MNPASTKIASSEASATKNGSQKKTCTHCSYVFDVTEDDLEFYDSVSPEYNGTKYNIPTPTFCPDCRQQRRLTHHNEMNLTSGGICGLCKKAVLTEYPDKLGKTYYCKECWQSDEWDPCDYGVDFDFTRPFFEQILELKMRVPAIALNIQGENENSDYMHLAGSCKNCYLLSHADFCWDCMYGYGFKKNTSCIDGFYNLHCELCYDSTYVHKSYGLVGCQDCVNCSSSVFIKDCVGCQHCFLCTGLKEKKYCFENKQLTKEEYEAKMKEIDLSSYAQYQECKAKLQQMVQSSIVKEYQGINLQNCSGNYLQNCKDVKQSFDCEDVEGGKFCNQVVLGSKRIYDIYQYGTNLQESMECSICGEESYHLLFCIDCHMSCSDLLYCWYLDRCRDCFGCVDMHDKRFCIFNKQYTEEEYNELVPKIIEHMKKTGEWGEFFPASIALHGYNITTAQLYYPLSKEEASAKGFKWEDDRYEPPTVEKVIPASSLPDSSKDVPDDILNWAIECEVTKKPFKLQKMELEFYRAQNLPIPRRCREQRHYDRFALRNPRKMWDRNCDKCQKDIQTTYSPERPETVYCEECYLAEVY